MSGGLITSAMRRSWRCGTRACASSPANWWPWWDPPVRARARFCNWSACSTHPAMARCGSMVAMLARWMMPMEAVGSGVDERFARGSELLMTVGLGERLRFRPAQLSGGQRQRVAVARAVANSPSVLLADEPTGELHSDDKARVLDLFKSLNQAGRTIVMVTHDPD